jgi:hypothetical protein
MTHPHTTGRGDSFHIWKAATNIQDKQTQTTSKGQPSNLGLEQATNSLLTSPTPKKKKRSCYEIILGTTVLDAFFQKHKRWKTGVRYGICDERSLLKTAARESAKCLRETNCDNEDKFNK